MPSDPQCHTCKKYMHTAPDADPYAVSHNGCFRQLFSVYFGSELETSVRNDSLKIMFIWKAAGGLHSLPQYTMHNIVLCKPKSPQISTTEVASAKLA